MFIGERNIDSLRHFLAGYIMAMQEIDVTYDDFLFGDFNTFLAQKYNDNRDFDWATLIIEHKTDGDSIYPLSADDAGTNVTEYSPRPLLRHSIKAVEDGRKIDLSRGNGKLRNLSQPFPVRLVCVKSRRTA